MRTTLMEALEAKGIPGWLLPDFYFMLTLAIIVGGGLVLLLWKRTGHHNGVASDLIFWGIPCLFFGAKLAYFLQFGFPSDLSGWWSKTGIGLYGGLIGLLISWAVYYVVRPYPVLTFLDCVAPGLALGLFLGRIGCFLAGCNGGLSCELPWAVRFPRNTPLFFHQWQAGLVTEWDKLSLPVHPTQLYESMFGLLALGLLLILFKSRQWEGQVFFTGMLWYSIYRFLTESLRADTGGLHPLSVFTFSQFVSLLLAVLSVAALLYLRTARPVARHYAEVQGSSHRPGLQARSVDLT
jgi:phosphatidylglycerol:prolipoprotein diacylglycerol transferase